MTQARLQYIASLDSRAAEQSLAQLDSRMRQLGRTSNDPMRGWAASARAADSALIALETRMRRLTQLAGGIIIGGAAGSGMKSALDLSAQWQGAAAQVRLVSSSLNEAADAQERLYRIAQETRSPIQDIAKTYQTMQNAAVGYGTGDGMRLTRTTSQLLAGSSAAGRSGAEMGLRQILTSGNIQGDELNQILDGAPNLASGITRGLQANGFQLNNLRGASQLAQSGQLTARDIVRALDSDAARSFANNLFGAVPATLEEQFQTVRNSLTRFFGTLDRNAGITDGINALLRSLTDRMDRALTEGGGTLGAGLRKGVEDAVVGVAAAIDLAIEHMRPLWDDAAKDADQHGEKLGTVLRDIGRHAGDAFTKVRDLGKETLDFLREAKRIIDSLTSGDGLAQPGVVGAAVTAGIAGGVVGGVPGLVGGAAMGAGYSAGAAGARSLGFGPPAVNPQAAFNAGAGEIERNPQDSAWWAVRDRLERENPRLSLRENQGALNSATDAEAGPRPSLEAARRLLQSSRPTAPAAPLTADQAQRALEQLRSLRPGAAPENGGMPGPGDPAFDTALRSLVEQTNSGIPQPRNPVEAGPLQESVRNALAAMRAARASAATPGGDPSVGASRLEDGQLNRPLPDAAIANQMRGMRLELEALQRNAATNPFSARAEAERATNPQAESFARVIREAEARTASERLAIGKPAEMVDRGQLEDFRRLYLELSEAQDRAAASMELFQRARSAPREARETLRQLGEERSDLDRLNGAYSQGERAVADLTTVLDAERRVRELARNLSPEAAENLRREALSYAEAQNASRRYQEEIAKGRQVGEGVGTALADSMWEAAAGAKSWADAMKSGAMSISKIAYQSFFQQPLSRSFGDLGSMLMGRAVGQPGAAGSGTDAGSAGGGSWISSAASWVGRGIGSLFGGGGSPAPVMDGVREGGGLVGAGGVYLVGEKGPEILHMPADGRVLNAGDTKQVLGAGGRGGSQVININIQTPNPQSFKESTGQIMAKIRDAASGGARYR